MAYTVIPHVLRLGTSVPSQRVHSVLPGVLRHDAVDGGLHKVAGQTLIGGASDVPVSCRVVLHERATARPVREVWSAADGAYAFERIKPGVYYVVAFTDGYNAVVRDRITAVPM